MQAVGLVPEGVEDPTQRRAQFVNIFWNDVRQGPVFGLVPDLLHRIKVRRVGWKPFHLQPRGAIREQLSSGRAMSRQTIPYQDDRAAQVNVDFSHEANEVCGPSVVISS
jgi:hypothetical protein